MRLSKICILLSLLFLNCKDGKKPDFEKVEYYHSDSVILPGPPDGTEKYEIYFIEYVSEKFKDNYKSLSNYGFNKKEVSEDFKENIHLFFTDKIQEKYYPNYKCLNRYNDILVFYDDIGIIVGVAKFDFNCNRFFYTDFGKTKEKNFFLKNDCSKYKALFNKDF